MTEEQILSNLVVNNPLRDRGDTSDDPLPCLELLAKMSRRLQEIVGERDYGVKLKKRGNVGHQHGSIDDTAGLSQNW